jgi:hypothetical protein
MKCTKTTILTLAAVGGLLACGSLPAQESTNAPAANPAASTNAAPHTMMRGPNMDGLARMLNLTDAQKSQFEPVLVSEYQQIHTLFQDTTLSPQEKRDQITAIRNATNTKLQAILNPDQFARWQKMTQPRSHRMMPPPTTNTPPASAP